MALCINAVDFEIPADVVARVVPCGPDLVHTARRLIVRVGVCGEEGEGKTVIVRCLPCPQSVRSTVETYGGQHATTGEGNHGLKRREGPDA